MKIAVIGSRDYSNLEAVHKYVCALPKGTIVISGGARGVDKTAETAAFLSKLECRVFPADWEKFGKRAGYLRNIDIVKEADIVVVFWDGKSKGTKHSIDLALSMGKSVHYAQ